MCALAVATTTNFLIPLTRQSLLILVLYAVLQRIAHSYGESTTTSEWQIGGARLELV